jgi:hypothetical protein
MGSRGIFSMKPDFLLTSLFSYMVAYIYYTPSEFRIGNGSA